MNTPNRTSTFVALAAAAALGTSLSARANDADVSADELAAQVEQGIHQLPNFSEGTGHYTITVEARNGELVLNGFVGSLEESNAVNRVLRSTPGVHMDRVDNHISVR